MNTKYISFITFLMLLHVLITGCAPDVDDLVSHLETGGISFKEPEQSRLHDLTVVSSTLRNNPDLKILETEDKTLVTVFRFKNEEKAQDTHALLKDIDSKNRLPERMQRIVGRQKIVQHRNFVVIVRYQDDNQETADKLTQHIQTM